MVRAIVRYYWRTLKSFHFGGRARRVEFWSFVILSYGMNVVLRRISQHLGWTFDLVDPEGALDFTLKWGGPITMLGLIYSSATAIQGVAIIVRRLHDVRLSGAWALVFAAVVYFVGGSLYFPAPSTLEDVERASGDFLTFQNACLGVASLILLAPGTLGPNNYGADPRSAPRN